MNKNREEPIKTNPITLEFKTHGFTFLEVLVAMFIFGVIGLLFFSNQTSSWKKTTGSKDMLVAGNMIERQIEVMRIAIDRSPADFFPPQSSQISENGINVKWTVSTATRPTDGATLTNVRKCDFVASWGEGKYDSLKVTTYISKMF